MPVSGARGGIVTSLTRTRAFSSTTLLVYLPPVGAAGAAKATERQATADTNAMRPDPTSIPHQNSVRRLRIVPPDL
jgi:hypothetical protein